MVSMNEYRTIKVRPATYHALKVLAAKTGVTMLDLIERLVKQEGDTTMKARFQARIRRGEWYDAARILIEQCDFHGFGTDEIDTWLAEGDVAYINSRELQELADAYCDWIRVARMTIEEQE
jgi:hypothetical protein